MEIAAIGIDIGERWFHVVGFDASRHPLVRWRFSCTELIRELANVPNCLTGMEACCGAHHLGRTLVGGGPYNLRSTRVFAHDRTVLTGK